MANKTIGNPIEGRQYRTDGSNSNQKPIEISASLGDGTTANSATPFLKLSGGVGAGTNGKVNVTTADITGSGATPAGTDKGVMISVVDAAGNEVDYWLAIYPVV